MSIILQIYFLTIMASRRQLKKNIQIVTSELLNYSYVNCFIYNKLTIEQLYEIMQKVAILNNDFLDRANHPDGTDNPKIVKAYYACLITEFNTQVEAACGEIENMMNTKKS